MTYAFLSVSNRTLFRAAKPLLSKLALSVLTLTTAATAQTYTNLYSFGASELAPNDPRYSGIIAQGRDGNFYSTAPDTWTGKPGAVFKITPSGVLTVLHQFNGVDGQATVSGLTLAAPGGNYYGTTSSGGTSGNGTIFHITHDGHLTTLHNFTGGADGGGPTAPPIQGLDGRFYGTTVGGAGSQGSVYRITWFGSFTILHTFQGPDGANPNAPLLLASDGNFYGTTASGGAHGFGTIFKINSSGKFQVIYDLDGSHGFGTVAPLIEGKDGNFYGVTASRSSAAFKITPQGQFTVLHQFTCGDDGGNSPGGLTLATDGNIYGTNNICGPAGWGVLFRIDSAGNFSTLHAFDWGSGASPQDTLLQSTNGILYGTTAVGGVYTQGTFYSLNLGLAPFVRLLPVAGRVGQTVDVLGQGFTGTSAVSFNGTPATFQAVSDRFLTAVVPPGATTGFVTVTTPAGTLTSDKAFGIRE